jgi:uncharacterized protein (DUF983 family)
VTLDVKQVEPSLLKVCSKCRETKLIIEFVYQKNLCKVCSRERKTLSDYEILSKNDTLKCPHWMLRRRRG